MTAATLDPGETLYITAKELARRWATDVGHLANLRTQGRPPAYMKFGSAIRYNVAVIEAYEGLNSVLPVT